jgi:hypothetical protein
VMVPVVEERGGGAVDPVRERGDGTREREPDPGEEETGGG